MSAFLRDDDRVFHTYSSYERGLDVLMGTYIWLDLTARGRQEDWEQPPGRSDGGMQSWLRRHDEYEDDALEPIRLALPIGLAFVALAAAGCGDGDNEGSATTSTADLLKLIGTVGSADDPDAYEISLRTEDGAEITTTLPPGEYTLEITDLSTMHNFHLDARYAGVDVATDVAGTGEKTAIVVLRDGVVHLRLRRAPGHDERDLQHPRSDTDAELERQNPALVLSRITSRSGRHRSQRLEGGYACQSCLPVGSSPA